jgi:hypothetical protein
MRIRIRGKSLPNTVNVPVFGRRRPETRFDHGTWRPCQSSNPAHSASLSGPPGFKIREEAREGQRTTLDVLNPQQALVNTRLALVTAQHDRVVASYAVLNAVGRLSPRATAGLAFVPSKPSTARPKRPVKYRDGDNVWSGVGTMPAWAKLKGDTLESYRV